MDIWVALYLLATLSNAEVHMGVQINFFKTLLSFLLNTYLEVGLLDDCWTILFFLKIFLRTLHTVLHRSYTISLVHLLM